MKRFPQFSLQSTVQGISWPAITSPTAAAHLAMQYQLEQTQWLDSSTILDRQLQQLDHIFSHACRHVPFYGNRCKNLLREKPGKLSWDFWRTLPLLTRDDIQNAANTLKSTSIPPQHGKTFKTSTSGSTGKPVTVWNSELTLFFWRAFTLREHFWHNRNFAGKLAAIRFVEKDAGKAPHGLTLQGWGRSTDNVLQSGPTSVLDIKSPIDQQACWLLTEQPQYLLTHPTNAHALADYFKATGKKLYNLLEVRTLGETLTAETEATCKEVWGVDVTDMYSSREVGYIALLCPEQRQYHVQAENVLVEILRDDGTDCLPGEVGKVVITCLHNYASPIIRYDIGDYAEVGESCACGRGLPVIKKIMGRIRNILTLPDGSRYWPIFNYKGLRQIVPFRQIQVLQHSLSELEVRLVAEAAVAASQETMMKEIIQKAVHYPFDIKFSYLEEIPRTRGGKYEEFISYV
jgi:phenylacetate-CoA ligase